MTLLILVCSQVPLHIMSSGPPTLFIGCVSSWFLTVELLWNLSLVISGMIKQFLGGANLIDVDFSLKEDCVLFRGAYKSVSFFASSFWLSFHLKINTFIVVFALIITLGQATVYVLTELYGRPRDIGVGIYLFTTFQLIVAALSSMNCSKNGSGINLFIAANICGYMVWKAFFLTTVIIGRSSEFEGAIVSLFHLFAGLQTQLGPVNNQSEHLPYTAITGTGLSSPLTRPSSNWIR